MKIENMEGSSEIYVDQPDGMSWIDWWRKQTNSKRTTCLVEGCSGKAEGAHVVPVGKSSPVYILSLCHHHNTDPDFEGEVERDNKCLVLCPDKYRRDQQ